MIAPGLISTQSRPHAAAGLIKNGTPTDDAVPWGFTAPEDHGATGDGVADDTAELGMAFSQSMPVWIPKKDYRITDTVAIPASCPGVMCWGGRMLFDRAHDRPAFEIGAQAQDCDYIQLQGLQAIAQSQSNWSDEASVGVKCWNAKVWFLDVMRVRGFTLGVQFHPMTDGSNNAWAYGIGRMGSIENCKISLDLDSSSGKGWTNENIVFGGRFVVESGVNDPLARIGLRTHSSTGIYPQANNMVFIGPIFELGAAGATGESVAWKTKNAYNELVNAAYRDADVLIRRDGEGGHGHYHFVWTGYSPAALDIGDHSIINGATSNRISLVGLRNILDDGASNNLVDYGGVIG